MFVFYASPWIPAEWIKAHGLEPRGVWLAPEAAANPLPLGAGVCAFAQSVLRLAESQPEAAVVLPSHCDQLRRGFDALVSSGRQRVFLFNLPATWQTAAAGRMFRSEVERLGRFLRGLGGSAPAPELLRETMVQYRQARSRLLAGVDRCSARQFAEAAARFHWDGSVHLPDQPAPPMAHAIPLAIVGGPLPARQWDLLDAIEKAGGRVALNGTEAGERSLAALPLEDGPGDPLERLTQSFLEHCADVFQRPNTRLYAWLGERLGPRRVRGLVLRHYVGCDLWRAEAQHLREAFGLPVLLLDADETNGCAPRSLGRIQAFLESLGSASSGREGGVR